MQHDPLPAEPMLFSVDDLDSAVRAGVLPAGDLERLLAWRVATTGAAAARPRVETEKGLNLVSVAYYFGAMLMISACAWFLGDKWQLLGSAGILATTLAYMAIAIAAGIWLRRQGYPIGGGLLITVGVCLTPLIVYSIEDLVGWWPGEDPGAYKNYYPLIHGSWIVMELATMAVAGLALYWVRFGFLTAPLAFSAWFFSMDIWALLVDKGELTFADEKKVSVVVGLAILAIGFMLDRASPRRAGVKSEDFAFWSYLFGLMAFWGGLTAMDSQSELNKFLYALLNLGLIGIAVPLRRATFMVFGVVGFHAYVGHLAYDTFKDSMLFPFVLALLGLTMILSTVWAQRWMRRAQRLRAHA